MYEPGYAGGFPADATACLPGNTTNLEGRACGVATGPLQGCTNYLDCASVGFMGVPVYDRDCIADNRFPMGSGRGVCGVRAPAPASAGYYL